MFLHNTKYCRYQLLLVETIEIHISYVRIPDKLINM